MFCPTTQEIRCLLGAISPRSPFGVRDYLAIITLCHTGMRIGEANHLQVRSIAREREIRDEIYLPSSITKTKKARTIPLNPIAQRALGKILLFNQKRGFSVEPSAPVFPWKNHGFLPIRESERVVQKLREKAGLSAKLTPHTFRHYFASRLVSAGVDLPTVQTLLGHERLSSTQIYTHTTEQRRRDAVMTLLQQESA